MYKFLIVEIKKCKGDIFKRYYMGILDRAATLKISEFIEITDVAIQVNPVWCVEWINEKLI